MIFRFTILLILIYNASVMPAMPESVPETKEIIDLRTRKTGSDWPTFLGPHGNAKSTETSLALPWPVNGPKIVWQMQAGEGYSAPAVSKGRLFLFHHTGDTARLTCMNSETGLEIWKFEYSSDYEDLYGFSNGPRATPLVENDRVYIHGVQGNLYCLNVADGKVRWHVNTNEDYSVVLILNEEDRNNIRRLRYCQPVFGPLTPGRGD